MNRRRKCTRKRVAQLWDSAKRMDDEDQAVILAYLVGWCERKKDFADGLERTLAFLVREARQCGMEVSAQLNFKAVKEPQVTDGWLEELYGMEDRRAR